MSDDPHLIILMGLKHSGKSTLARQAGRHFQIPSFDLDEEIAQIARGRFPELSSLGDASDCLRNLYRLRGKEVFESLEAEAAEELANRSGDYGGGTFLHPFSILALGGGTMENGAAMNSLKNSALTIFLDTPVDVLFPRAIRNGIPAMLDPARPRESFAELFERRRALALDYADTIIELDGKTLEEAFELLRERLKEFFDGGK